MKQFIGGLALIIGLAVSGTTWAGSALSTELWSKLSGMQQELYLAGVLDGWKFAGMSRAFQGPVNADDKNELMYSLYLCSDKGRSAATNFSIVRDYISLHKDVMKDGVMAIVAADAIMESCYPTVPK